MLRRVTDVPAHRPKGGTFVDADMRQFLRDDTMDACEIRVEGHTDGSVTSGCRKYLKAHGVTGVDIRVRDGHVYLVKELRRGRDA